MTSDFEGFFYPRFYPLHLFSYLNHFYSLWFDAVLDWGLNPEPPVLEASTIPLGYRGGGIFNVMCLTVSCIKYVLFCCISFYFLPLISHGMFLCTLQDTVFTTY